MEKINSIKSLSYIEPEGAFYIFPNFRQLIGKSINNKKIDGSLALAELLLNEAKVAVVPGIAFGADDCFRLSYATSMSNIEKGLDRIAQFINKI
jgi:aspartate aminotransferase